MTLPARGPTTAAAGMIRDRLDRQHREPATSKGKMLAFGAGFALVEPLQSVVAGACHRAVVRLVADCLHGEQRGLAGTPLPCRLRAAPHSGDVAAGTCDPLEEPEIVYCWKAGFAGEAQRLTADSAVAMEPGSPGEAGRGPADQRAGRGRGETREPRSRGEDPGPGLALHGVLLAMWRTARPAAPQGRGPLPPSRRPAAAAGRALVDRRQRRQPEHHAAELPPAAASTPWPRTWLTLREDGRSAVNELPSVPLTRRFLALCLDYGSMRLALQVVAVGRSTGVPGLPVSSKSTDWNADEMRAVVDYLEGKRGGRRSR